jgi:alkylated DNA nucleotide flippase Atl1
MNDDKAAQLKRFLGYLNEVKTRTTYGVIAKLLKVNTRSVGQLLGEKRPEASWVVNSKTKDPTDYTESEKHPELYRTTR